MRHVCLWLLGTLAMAMIACGGGASTSNNVAGNWSATLSDSKGATFMQFSALLTQGSSYQISVTNLTFSVASSCFGKGTAASSTFGVSQSMDGTPGAPSPNAFQLTMLSSQSNLNGVNQLVLQGNLSENTISGIWTGTGSGTGCADNGSFTMSRM